MRTAFASATMLACTAAKTDDVRPPISHSPCPRVGTILVGGKPSAGSEAFLLGPDGRVVGFGATDSSGRYVIAPPAGFVGGTLMSKFYRPIVGVRAVAVGPTCQPVDFAVADTEAVTLSGELEMPPGVALDWIEIGLTPRHMAGVPANAELAVLAVDTSSSIKGMFFTEKISRPSFSFRVLPGTWDITSVRFVDGPKSIVPAAVPNLSDSYVTLPDGTRRAKQYPGGYLLELKGDLPIRIVLKADGS